MLECHRKNNLVSRVKKGQNRYTPVLKQSKNVFPPIVLLPLLMVPYCTYLETLFAIHPDSFGTAPCLTKKKRTKIQFSPLFTATNDGLFKEVLLTILQYMRPTQSIVGHVWKVTVTRRFHGAVTTPDVGNNRTNQVIVVCALCDIT